MIDGTPILIRRVAETIERHGIEIEVSEINSSSLDEDSMKTVAHPVTDRSTASLFTPALFSSLTFLARSSPLTGHLPAEQREIPRGAIMRQL